MKKERHLRDEALTRLSLDIEQFQRTEAALKSELRAKNSLIESCREDVHRQMSNTIEYFIHVHRLTTLSSIKVGQLLNCRKTAV